MENSRIPWCHHTFNPWTGCQPVSPGCVNCFAAAQNKFFGWSRNASGKPDFTVRKRTSETNWRRPLAWEKSALSIRYRVRQYLLERGYNAAQIEELSRATWGGNREIYGMAEEDVIKGNIVYRPRVFCGSLCDWLDDKAQDVWRRDLLRIMYRCPHTDFLVLTKRPENFDLLLHRAWACGGEADFGDWLGGWMKGKAPSNIWVGVTVEDGERESRVANLLNIPAAMRFLSCEPLLGPVSLSRWLPSSTDKRSCRAARCPNCGWVGETGDGKPAHCPECASLRAGETSGQIHWVIVGCESGNRARHMQVEWARDLKEQCCKAGVSFFMKQMEINGKVSDDLDMFPADLRIREFPKLKEAV